MQNATDTKSFKRQDVSWKTAIDRACEEAAMKLEKLAGRCSEQPDAKTLFFEGMNDLLVTGCANLQKQFSDSNEEAKVYFLEKISPVLNVSVFYRRASEQPQGYPGDYLTIDMVYCGKPLPGEGHLPLAKQLDDWFLNTPSAKACRHRHEWLANNLGLHYSHGAQHIASFACGPCREIDTFLSRQRDVPRPLTFDCFDFDPAALDYARNLLSPHARPNVTCRFHQTNLIKAFLKNKSAARIHPFNLIYCAGFTDYLGDAALIRLLDFSYQSLAPGGTVLVAQFLHHPNDLDRNAMEWCMDWNLIYRTEEQLRSAFQSSAFGDRVEIRKDPLGLIAFCEASKPA